MGDVASSGNAKKRTSQAPYDTPENLERLERALEMGRVKGLSAADVSLAFVLTHPSRPFPIVGARRVETYEACLQALSGRAERRGALLASHGRIDEP